VVVDVTNYVMLELSSRCNVFDLDLPRKAGSIAARAHEAKAGTPDGEHRELGPNMLRIVDAKRPWPSPHHGEAGTPMR
jgi:phenylalanyl-tRNA synthetase beta subunit